MSFGLEEDEITGYSNGQCCFVLFCVGLEEDKITWFSNAQKYTGNNEFGLEEGKITWYSNITKELQRCKEAKLHDAQTLHPLKITNVQV